MSTDAEYETRPRKRLGLLKEQLEAGKIQFAPHLKTIESLKAVRYGPDGEIDLSTVDGSVRSLALAIEAVHHREETKKVISLPDLQDGYFKFIESNFGPLYKQMLDGDLTPFQVGSGVSEDPEGVRIFHKAIPDVLDWVQGLWGEVHDVAHIHTQDIRGLKAVFGGETFPQGNKSIVSSSGVYVDCIVLPDPFIRSDFLLKGEDEAVAVRSLITSALSLLQYKDAVLAQIDTPLAVIVPDSTFLNESMRDTVFRRADGDAVTHLSEMFGRSFGELGEAEEFLKGLKTPADVVSQLTKPQRLLFDTEWTDTAQEQIEKYVQMFLPHLGSQQAGMAVMASTVGRMRQAGDLLFRSQRLGGSPLIEAPTSWRYFNWKLEYSAGHTNTDAHLTLHMTKALQNAASGEMTWLGAVPVEALIEMRKQDVLPELRSILSAGVRELMELRPDNFHRTSDRVIDNIQNAFDAHRKKLTELTGKKWRFAGVELGSCIVKGVVQIASACGIPGVSLVGAALEQAVDIPKLKDIPGRARSLRQEGRALSNSAVGMLFQQQTK